MAKTSPFSRKTHVSFESGNILRQYTSSIYIFEINRESSVPYTRLAQWLATFWLNCPQPNTLSLYSHLESWASIPRVQINRKYAWPRFPLWPGIFSHLQCIISIIFPVGLRYQHNMYIICSFYYGVLCTLTWFYQLPTVMKRRFTLTQSSVEEDFERMKLKDYQQKASDLHEVKRDHLV